MYCKMVLRSQLTMYMYVRAGSVKVNRYAIDAFTLTCIKIKY